MAGSFSSVGLHSLGTQYVDVYLDDVRVERRRPDPATPRTWGNGVTIGAFGDQGQHLDPYVGRLEFWDEPGGTLIDAHDFNDLSGWGQAYPNHSVVGGYWHPAGSSGDPGSGASYLTAGAPVGAEYVRLVDIYWTRNATRPVYVAVAFKRNNGAEPLNGPGSANDTGMSVGNWGWGLYLVDEEALPKRYFVPQTIPGRGWTVGKIGMDR